MSDKELKSTIAIEVDGSGVSTGVSAVKKSLNSLGEAAKATGVGFGGVATQADEALKKADRSTKTFVAQVKNAATDIKAELDKLNIADKFELKAVSKGLDPSVYKPYVEYLRTVVAEQDRLAVSTNGVALSAGQLKNAIRGVPAQFTDIVTSLASGQSAMTVFMQQGGQLKDMFGGVGNAAKALGSYVLGLINPISLTAATVGVLAVAHHQGSAEAKEYAKALILTGNAAGTTVGQLQAMAAGVAQATGATQGAAAEALTAFAGASNVASENFSRFAAVAIKVQRETGAAVADTVAKFAELGKAPLEASIKLNDSMHHLTAEVYRQIKSLEEHGDKAGAAAVAQKAFADASEKAMDSLKANLGTAETAWRAVTDAAKGAWDAMLGVGRKESLGDKLSSIASEIAAIEQKAAPGRGIFAGLSDADKAKLENLKEQQRYFALIKQSQDALAAGDAKRAALQTLLQEWDQRSVSLLDKKGRMQRELDVAQAQGARLVEAGLIKQVDLNNQLAAIREKFKESAKGTPGDEFASQRGAAKEWAEFYERFENLNAKAAGKVGDLTHAQVELEKYLKSPAYANMAEPARQLALQSAYAAVAQEQLAREIAGANKENEAAATAYEQLLKSQEKHNQSLDDAIRKQQEHNSAIGVSAEAGAALEIANMRSHADALERKADLVDLIYLDGQYGDALREEAKRLRELAGEKQAGAVKQAAEDARKEWKKTAEKINDSITDALMRGFESGKGFAENLRDTVVNLFKTLVLRPTVSAIVNPVAQGITGALGFSGAANAATTATGLGNIAGGIAAFGGTLATGFMNTLVGSGMSAGLASAGAMIANGAWASGLGMAAGALGPLALGVAALSSLIKSNGGTPTSNTGNAAASYDARGNRIGYETFYGGSSANVDNTLAGLQATYQRSAAALGIGTVGTRFSFGGNTGRDGESPNFALGGSAGGVQFYQGETTASEAAISLAASRAVFAALQGSDLPAYLAKVFDGLTAGELSQDQINNTLAYAQTLKQVRDGLLETREPLQILKDNVAEGIAALGTSSETFKTDFVAAIDGGITPEKLAQWQGLQSAMTELATASGKAADAVKDVGRSIADIANERQRLQDQLDELTLSSTELLAKQRNAIDASNRSLFDQVQVAQTARNVLEQRNELELQLLQLQGDSTELRKREMEAIDVSNRALFEQIQTAQTARTTLDQRNNLELQLLQLQGNTVELRKRELQALEPSNRVLQESIYALQDAKAAQDAYNTALANAQSRMSAASSALESAQNAVDAIRSTGTDQYLSALDKVAQAQDAIAQAAQSASQKMVQLGQSLRDFVTREVLSNAVGTPSIAAANASFARTLAQAKGGNADAIADLENRGRIAIDAARAGSTTSAQFQSIRNMVLQSVSGVAATLPNAPQAQGADLQQRLIDAQTDLAEALRVANAIGAPLQRQQADLIAKFGAAQSALASAQAEYAAASAVLEAIKTNTAQTAANVLDLNGNLVVQLHTSAQSEITKLIKVIGDDTGLTPDLRALALMSAESVSKTIELIATSDISPDIKALALSASTSVTKTIGIIVSSSSMTDENKALALAVSDSIAKSIVLSATSNMAPDLKILALMATESVTKTVGVVVSSSLSDENKALALMSSNAVVKTIGVVVNSSSLSGENRALALMVSESVSKNIALAATSNMAPDLKTLALLESGSIAKYISLVANSSLSPDDKNLALMASNSIVKTINTALGANDSTALSIALAHSDTLVRTISAVGGTLTDDQRTVLRALTGASSVSVTVSGSTTSSVTFNQDDPIRSVWQAIKTASEQNAGYAYGIHSALSWIASMVSNMLNHISTVQIVFNRGDGSVFAKGGAFTNKIVDSPTLFDQSLMGEAGPEAIMPLKRGPDGSLGVIASVDYRQFGRGNDALVAEIRTLREENRAQASAIVGLNQRMTKLMERWDGNGLPSTRVEA